MYIRILSALKLATVRKVAPQLKFDRTKVVADLNTLQSVITHRYAVMTSYARSLKDACAAELANRMTRSAAGAASYAPNARRIKHWLLVDPAKLTDIDRAKLAEALAHSKALATAYAMRRNWARCGAVHRVVRTAARQAAGLVPPRQASGIARAVLA